MTISHTHCSWPTPESAQGLFVALHSKIAPGSEGHMGCPRSTPHPTTTPAPVFSSYYKGVFLSRIFSTMEISPGFHSQLRHPKKKRKAHLLLVSLYID